MQTSSHFKPVLLTGRNLTAQGLNQSGCSGHIAERSGYLPIGAQTYLGIPFDSGDGFFYVNDGTVNVTTEPFLGRWIIFLHSSETPNQQPGVDGIVQNYRGMPPLMEPVCDYVLRYEDGTTVTVPIRARMEICDTDIGWGNNPLLAQPHMRGYSVATATEDISAGRQPNGWWGGSQTRVAHGRPWDGLDQWVFALLNPHPDKMIVGLYIVRQGGNVFLFAVTATDIYGHPLRYGRRQKAVLTLTGKPNSSRDGLNLVDIDLGHIISVTPRLKYNPALWSAPCGPKPHADNEQPTIQDGEYIVEFDAHADACLYLGEERTALSVRDAQNNQDIHIAPAELPVTLKVIDPDKKPVPVRIHAHGIMGEYLPPRNRHRLPNPFWFEDYSADVERGRHHWCSYIDGTAEYLLPLGEVWFEVTKGFEIAPTRKCFTVTPETKEITIQLDHTLNWRAKGWVTADTHVHFLSPQTALLEGEAEGVNVVNLLASQWGELMTGQPQTLCWA